MFGETFRYSTTGTVLALGCGVVAAGGLILLTTERLESTQVPAADGTAEPELTAEPSGAVPRQRTASETELEEAVLEEVEGILDGPDASHADPASYVPLSASIPVPVALLDRRQAVRQILMPPARR
jgi:hypothetical protein